MGGNQKDDTITPESGWDRLKLMFTSEKYSMEKDIVYKMSKTAFACGFFLGGFSTNREAERRFDTYAVGKKFLNKRDAIRRKLDYRILMFAKNGFRMGIRSAILAGSVMTLATTTTVYRDRFAAWYFPVYSGFGAFLIHRAAACGVFAFPLGLYGQLQALGLGTTTGLMLSGCLWLYSLYIDKSINEAYFAFKNDYEEDVRIAKEKDENVTKLMAEENIKIRWLAYRRMHEIEQQKLLDAAEKNDI